MATSPPSQAMRPAHDIPTPPVTPQKSEKPELPDSRVPSIDLGRVVLPDEPLLFSGSFTPIKAVAQGAWSTVFLATEDDPDADASSSSPPRQPTLLAVKKPSHRAAKQVIHDEARTLTALSAQRNAPHHIVAPFRGLDAATGALVLPWAPRTLAAYVEAAAADARANPSTARMFEPVVGRAAWLELAARLTGSLAWLHELGVVHGDVKPANILLFPYGGEDGGEGEGKDSALGARPLLCDFTSSRLLSAPPRSSRSDAVTTAYASPELLASLSSSSSRGKDAAPPPPAATPAADVWALAATLVSAAAGEEPYGGAGSNSMMRLAMAREGRLLGGVSCAGSAMARVRKGGLVERCVRRALERREMDRIEAGEWRDAVLEEVKSFEREKKGAN